MTAEQDLGAPSSSADERAGAAAPRWEIDGDKPSEGPTEAALVFRVGSIWLAAPARAVDEIRPLSSATRVPQAPEHIPGLVNLRGHAVPLLDLARFLGIGSQAGARTDDEGGFFGRIVVVTAAGMRAGILCDQVRGVSEIALAQREPPTVIQGQRLLEYALGEVEHHGQMTLLLDLDKLIDEARVRR